MLQAPFAAARPCTPASLHPAGFRGCTSVEQSIIGGCAHLLNFEGTDTLSAAFYAQVGQGAAGRGRVERWVERGRLDGIWPYGHMVCGVQVPVL